MKVLLSSYHNPSFMTITEYIERAIRNLGHDLIIFEDRQHIIPGRVRRRLKWLDQIDLQLINKKLISLALKTKPDIAIIAGGHRIVPKVLKTLKANGICLVLWTTDAPLNFQPIIDLSPNYDYIFCQGTEAIELLDHAGIKGANWLPVACDPHHHRTIDLLPEEQKEYGNDIVFVGSFYPNRAELFEKLTSFDLGIWGPGWERHCSNSPLRKFIRGGHLKPDVWLKIYSASKIILATHYQNPKNSFPVYQASPRIFEALACGAFVISDNQRDVFSLFNCGEHLVRFNTPDDLIEKIQYYLDHPLEREEIARQGREEVLDNHTYVHRIEKLLSFVEKRQ